MHKCIVTSSISLFGILYVYANIPEELCSICSMNSIKGKGQNTHGESMRFHENYYFYFHP